MAQKGWTHQDLAVKMSVARPTATQWCSGARRPGTDKAARLQRLTGGRVRSSDWEKRRFGALPSEPEVKP